MIIHNDCLKELQTFADASIDFVCTDPPYGYGFMGLDWDKAVPGVDIWKECLRVLKPGAFMCVMSAPRADVQCAMISRLIEAGFRLDFTPLYWTYASGFPKAGNMAKLIDKRLGIQQEKTGIVRRDGSGSGELVTAHGRDSQLQTVFEQTRATSSQAKALDGSYAGFQPKPAVEVILIAMKPLSEKTFVDQALKNGKGISWLDEGRISFDNPSDMWQSTTADDMRGGIFKNTEQKRHLDRRKEPNQAGRFPANLLVSDDVLNNGIAGSYSRYFDLDAWWATTLPFLIVPKAAKSERNQGLQHLPDTVTALLPLRSKDIRGDIDTDDPTIGRQVITKNCHPTVKPLKLMSYLLTLFSRPGDTVLDPFVGSGTTCVAATMLGRASIGIEREAAYVEIAKARLEALEDKPVALLSDYIEEDNDR